MTDSYYDLNLHKKTYGDEFHITNVIEVNDYTPYMMCSILFFF